MKQKSFYLSGPMRGYEQFNFPAFDAAAAAGRKKGFKVISPADLDRANGIDENALVEEASGFPAQRAFAERDCDVLLGLRCENGDGIALLPGWEKSTGAIAELMLARWLGLAVLDARTWKPFTQEDFAALDLSPLVQNVRRYIGDAFFSDREESLL